MIHTVDTKMEDGHLVCFDDLVICHKNQIDCAEIISQVNEGLEVKNIGNAKFYFGIQFEWEPDRSYLLSQKQKTLELSQSLSL